MLPSQTSPGEPARCPGCGASAPAGPGLTHEYVASSAGCWRTFGEIQADEALRFGYPPAHGLVVDAYMAQHPGDGTNRRDRQSVFVHLVGLCAVLERHLPPARVIDVFRRVLRGRDDFPLLERASSPGAPTVLHLVGARDLADYEGRARAWASAVWETWADQRPVIRSVLDSAR
jgi:hypothetical protein